MTEDKLIVVFDNSLDDEAGICVLRVVNGKTFVLKLELGEQADILYRLLTEQMTKAEIKAENKGEWIKTKDQYGNYHYTCSKCGNDIATKSDAFNDNFCSECGARMKGGEE